MTIAFGIVDAILFFGSYMLFDEIINLCLYYFFVFAYTYKKEFLTGFGVMHGIFHTATSHIGKATKTSGIQRCFCVYSPWYDSRYAGECGDIVEEGAKKGQDAMFCLDLGVKGGLGEAERQKK